jgi:hypothetical protein
MVQLFHTSRGPLTIQRSIVLPLLGTNVTVTVFDESGREKTTKAWSSKFGYRERSEPLSAFLTTEAELPESEAHTLAEYVLHSWPSEAAEADSAEARKLRRRAWVTLAALVIVAALAGVGLLSLILLAV